MHHSGSHSTASLLVLLVQTSIYHIDMLYCHSLVPLHKLLLKAGCPAVQSSSVDLAV